MLWLNSHNIDSINFSVITDNFEIDLKVTFEYCNYGKMKIEAVLFLILLNGKEL